MGKSTVVSLFFVLKACTANPNVDFDRHSMSWLILPTSGDTLLFHAKTSPRYPADSPDAEGIRKLWIETWLSRRGLCGNGFDIVDGPRPFHSHEDNPHLAQLRYELECKP
ncbi:MAG: hypothetical protein AAF438_07610 [Pseudomonadota bacterium]